MAVAHIGIVYARIALRPAGSCCTPNSRNPFQPVMLKNDSPQTFAKQARGMRIDSPCAWANASMPSAASGSVMQRNVSGASSSTPIFRTGQLQPQTSASSRTSNAARVGAIDGLRIKRWQAGSRIRSVFRDVKRARLRDPSVAPDPTGELGEPRFDIVDLAIG